MMSFGKVRFMVCLHRVYASMRFLLVVTGKVCNDMRSLIFLPQFSSLEYNRKNKKRKSMSPSLHRFSSSK